MSIAEFYIDNGIDPGDPDSFDAWMAGAAHGDYDGAWVYRAVKDSGYSYNGDGSYSADSSFEDYSRGVQEDRARADARSQWLLDESELDYVAQTRGWTRLEDTQPAMASYRRDGVRLNFYLSTGTVGSYLDHPRQGKTQLFRRQITMEQAPALFDNPRAHTGRGYHNRQQRQEQRNHQYPNAALPCSNFGKSCAQCNSMKPRTSFSKNQLRKGDAARCTECVNATGGGGFGRGDGDSSSGSGWGWPAKRRRRGW